MIPTYSLSFDPLIAGLFIAGLAGAAAIVLAFSLWHRARGSWLRAGAMAVLVLALWNPVITRNLQEPLTDVVVLAVDESRSQAIGTRKNDAEKAATQLAEVLSRTPGIEVRRLTVGATAAAGGLRREGTLAIDDIARAWMDVPQSRRAAAILITDGQVHDVPEDPARANLGAPLHVLLTGKPNEVDRRLTIIDAPRYGIVGRSLTFTVRVDDEAVPAGATVNLAVRRDGEAVANSPISVPVGVPTPISVNIERRGLIAFELEIEPGSQELTLENNRAAVGVAGVRDRLRVLLVSGAPHAGERTWRSLLKADPAVDLVHFTILRPPEKYDATPINEMSLIAFPVRELFELKLKEFDLVIFDRYRRQGVLSYAYLQNIVNYIDQGGAFLEAAGPTNAIQLSLYATPLKAALPGAPTGETSERPFRPMVSDLGQRHPVTQDLPGANSPLDKEGKASDPTWGRWFRQIGLEAQRGEVLMTGLDNRPLLVLDRYGKGRVAQLASDHMWLWSRGFEGGGPQAELLRRIAHWLMKEPDLEEEDLRLIAQGNQLEIRRRSLSKDFAPITLTLPSGETKTIAVEEEAPGRAVARIEITESGLYRAQDGQRKALVAVGSPNPLEVVDVRATGDKLRPLAAATKGSVHWLHDGMPGLRRVASDQDAGGRDWMGLKAGKEARIIGARRITLLPPMLAIILLLGAIILAWRREGQ